MRQINRNSLATQLIILNIFSIFLILLISTCTKKGTQKQQPVTLLRQPYLQNVFKDSVSVLWKTTVGEQCYVKYGMNFPLPSIEKGIVKNHKIGLNSTADTINVVEDDGDIEKYLIYPDSTNTFMNEVTIKGLKRGQKYFYEIYTDKELLASGEDYFFVTEGEKNAPFSFYAMGDIGNSSPTSAFQDVTARRLCLLEDRPDFGIGLGDIVYKDGESEWYDKYFFQPMQNVLKSIPFYPALGNHDWHKDPDLNFKKEWKLPNNEHFFSFDYGKVHFIALDSREGGLYDYEEQVSWFENDLIDAQGKYDWIVVYLHHNGFTCTYKHPYDGVVSLYPLFAKYNVDLVLNGHAHTYERLHPFDKDGHAIEKYKENTDLYPEIKNGFMAITTGAGGQLKHRWRPGKCELDIVAKAEHRGHFCVLEINEKKLQFRAYASLNGDCFDEFVMDKSLGF